MTLFGIFGCLNRRVASSHCPGRTFSCVTKSMASLKAHQEPTLYNRAVRLSPAGVARLDRVDTDMDQMGLGHRGPEDLVGPPLSRISIDDETREGVEEREGEPEQLREVPHRGFWQAHRPAKGSDLEAHDELPDGRASDRLREGRIGVQHDATGDAVDPRRPDAFEVQERPERGEDRDQVQEERDDSLQPVHLKRPVMPEEVETAHHERIPKSHRRTSLLKHPCTRRAALTNRGHSDGHFTLISRLDGLGSHQKFPLKPFSCFPENPSIPDSLRELKNPLSLKASFTIIHD